MGIMPINVIVLGQPFPKVFATLCYNPKSPPPSLFLVGAFLLPNKLENSHWDCATRGIARGYHGNRLSFGYHGNQLATKEEHVTWHLTSHMTYHTKYHVTQSTARAELRQTQDKQ